MAKRPAPKNVVRVSDIILERSKMKRGANNLFNNPFVLPQFPKSSLPPSGGMAKDSSVSENLAWAAAALAGVYSEGLVFLGYSVLAEMATRPEYRRMAEVLAQNMTRQWIKLKSKSDDSGKEDRIKKIEDTMKRMRVQHLFYKLAEQDAFFGRSHLYIDTGKTDDRDELVTNLGDGQNAVSKAKVGKGDLKGFKIVEAVWCYPTDYNSFDPLKPSWYRPEQWFVQGKPLHASRLLTFVSREVPDILKPAYSFGGLPLSQIAKPYVDNWLRTRQSVADIISAFSVMVLATDLTQSLNANNGDDIFRRADLFNNLRDNRGLMMIDKTSEDFKNVSAPLSGLDSLQAQTQEHMSAVTGIPIVILLGIQPAGLNASSEGELKSFYAWIHSLQEAFFRPNLTKVINFIQLSDFGDVDPDIVFDFEPLEPQDDKESAEAENVRAQTDSLYVDVGVLNPIEVRKRLANDPDSGYQGLDVDDLPAPPEVVEPEPEPGNESPPPRLQAVK